MDNSKLGSNKDNLESKPYSLKDSPIGDLTQLSGFISGLKNPLCGFEEHIIKNFSELFEIATKNRADVTELKSLLQTQITTGEGDVIETKMSLSLAQQMLDGLRKILIEELSNEFWKVFQFVINNLSDSQLKAMGRTETRKEIIESLYELANYFEDNFTLGEGIKMELYKRAMVLVENHGEQTKSDILVPSKYRHAPIPEAPNLTSRYSQTLRPLKGVPPVGNGGSRRQTLHGIPLHPNVTSAKVPTLGQTENPNNDDEDASKPKRTTMRWDSSDKKMDEADIRVTPFTSADVNEVMRNSEEVIKAASTVLTASRNSTIPQDLLELTGTEPMSTSSEETIGPELMIGETTDIDEALLRELEDEKTEVKIPSFFPMRDLPELDFEEDEIVEMSVDEKGVTSLDRMSFGPRVMKKPVGQPKEASLPKIMVIAPAENDIQITLPAAVVPSPKPPSVFARMGQSINSGMEKVGGWFKKTFSFSKKEQTAELVNKNAITQRIRIKDITEQKSEKVVEKQTDLKPISFMDRLRKNARPIAFASGLAALGAAGTAAYLNQQDRKEIPVASNSSAAPSFAHSVESLKVAPSASALVAKKDVEVKKVDDNKPAPVAEVAKPREFAKVLSESKSPLIQAILKDGKVKLGTNNITDAMISPFKGLATDAQKVELANLEMKINWSLGVFFNEHFGTEAAAQKTLKDHPEWKSIYSTAKYAQKKGWINSSLTKASFPDAYAFALQILGDSSELDLDKSGHGVERVKGNMFQAKIPGDMLNFRKDNGKYHVIVEAAIQIFDGEKTAVLAKTLVEDSKKIAAGVKVESGTEKKVPAVKADDKSKTDVILPNIIGGHGLDFANPMSIFDRGYANGSDLDAIEEGFDVDKGWDEIIDQANLLEQERDQLEKTGVVEFDLDLSLTSREEKFAVIPGVAEKLVKLYPNANPEMIRKLIRQYGYIGLNGVTREKGHFKATLNPNFAKILKGELKKKIKSGNWNS